VAGTTPDRHGGTLAAEADLGDHAAVVPAPDPDAVPVLVVDDQAPFRAAARALVPRMAGFALCGEAATGEEGVEAAATLRPGLVLMDIKLPGIDGVEATRRILATAGGTVVVLCSTYQPSDLPDGATDCGAAAYVRKEDLAPAVLAGIYAAATTPSGAAGPG
jgi:DNA-binding NarL/FixJ family response regulator